MGNFRNFSDYIEVKMMISMKILFPAQNIRQFQLNQQPEVEISPLA